MQYFKRYSSILFFSLSLITVVHSKLYAQTITNKTINKIEDKAITLNRQLDKQTKRYLHKLQKAEAKLLRKLQKKDSMAAKQLLETSKAHYSDFVRKVQNTTNKAAQPVRQYLHGLDSTTAALKFISENSALVKATTDKVKGALAQCETLQQKLMHVRHIEEQLQQRKAQLAEVLGKYDLSKYLKKYNKAAYYYTEQIATYKAALKNPAQMEKLVLTALHKIPAFQKFVNQNNLQSMFPGLVLPVQSIGTAIGTVTSYSGLQSRQSLQQSIMDRFGNDKSMNAAMANQFKEAVGNYNQAKQQMEKAASNPKKANGFKPNPQKLKTWKERTYFLMDIQFGKRTNYFPNSSNIGVQAGYKLSDEANFGLGIAYKMGLGTGWKQIKVTSESLGWRTFFEYKTTRTLYARIGAEANYTLKEYSINNLLVKQNWNRSFLLGASKRINFKGKVASIQLMYDFLYKEKFPIQSPLVYRISYHF
jgi:hypothetical protein